MASSGSPRRVPPSVGARVLNLRFGVPRGSHGPPTAPAKRTTSVTDEQRATRAQVLHPAPPVHCSRSRPRRPTGGRSSLPKAAPPSSEALPGKRFGVQSRIPRVSGHNPSGPTHRAARLAPFSHPRGMAKKSMVLQERKRRTATRADYSPRPSKRPRNQSSIRVRQDEPEREPESPSAAARRA